MGKRTISADLSAALWQVAREASRLRVAERNLDAALAMLADVEEREDRELNTP